LGAFQGYIKRQMKQAQPCLGYGHPNFDSHGLLLYRF